MCECEKQIGLRLTPGMLAVGVETLHGGDPKFESYEDIIGRVFLAMLLHSRSEKEPQRASR